ncbi:MAG: aldehyde dehydrogenase EutE [Planctomycetes bacterium]|nr:aldehyde dehydrogenase EutE [Planctomycetota bacterium]
MLQVTDDLIRSVVQEVLAGMKTGSRSPGVRYSEPPGSGASPSAWGVFESVDDAVKAASKSQRQLESLGLDARKKATDCIRKICIEQANMLGLEEMEETKIGRLKHKVEKLVTAGERSPGVEFLRTNAFGSMNNLTLEEFAPFGVIGAITPVTHSLPTLANNAISMIAAGNTIVVNPHPSGARVACHGVQLFNQAIHKAIGLDNLVTILGKPTLESAQAIFDHRDVKMLCVTGGPAVGRAALRSPKRAIVAGPGNPPVVVDETADLDNAARSIIYGAAYDNNLLCIAEKEVFVVASVFDEMMDAMTKAKAVRLNPDQIAKLTKAAFVAGEGGKLIVNKDLIGQDAAVLAKHAGVSVAAETELLFGETDESHPFVDHEQMMPFVPFIRCSDVDACIALAKKYEHGFKHTAIIHSRNVDTITRMGREMDVTIFVQNGPCTAGLGEAYLSFSIATPTGEGVTTPLTFSRVRRSTTMGSMRVV